MTEPASAEPIHDQVTVAVHRLHSERGRGVHRCDACTGAFTLPRTIDAADCPHCGAGWLRPIRPAAPPPPSTADPAVQLHRDAIQARLLGTTALGDLPPLEPLVDRYLYRDTLAMLYGPSGSGKTFQALAWALHVATGTWWERRAVTPVPVLYVAAEGVRMIAQRVDSWSRHHGVHQFDRHKPVHWHPGAVNLFEPGQADALTDIAAGLGVGLVVIDTLARCAAGAEENSARDMGRVIEACDAIRHATGACVLLVHHSGKDATNGARGSSVLRAAMDTEVSLDAAGRLTVTKAKDWAPPASLSLSLQPVGDSCVFTTGTNGPTSSPSQRAVLRVLEQIATPDGIPSAAWRDVAMAGELAEKVSRSSFYTALKALDESNQVQNIGTDRSPRYIPTPTGGQP